MNNSIRQLQGIPFTIGLLTPAEAIVVYDVVKKGTRKNRTLPIIGITLIFWIYADEKNRNPPTSTTITTFTIT